MTKKKFQNLFLMAIITLFIMSCGYFDYPSEDELALIEWNVTSVDAGKYGLNIHVVILILLI